MMTIDQLVGRLMDLEGKYYELQSKYQTLIHQYEELKATHDNSRPIYLANASMDEETWEVNDEDSFGL